MESVGSTGPRGKVLFDPTGIPVPYIRTPDSGTSDLEALKWSSHQIRSLLTFNGLEPANIHLFQETFQGIINTHELVSSDKNTFLSNLNIADDVKVLLEELIDDGYMTLNEMEVFAFEKFQQLTKANATDVLNRYKGPE